MKKFRVQSSEFRVISLVALIAGAAPGATNVFFTVPMSTVNALLATIPGTTGTVATVVADLDIAEATLASITGTVATVAADLDIAEATLASTTGDVAQAQADITAIEGQTNNWNAAYGWGDHSTNGYLTGFNELDPAWTEGTNAIWVAIAGATDTNAVTSIIINSVTNTPTDGVVDLGIIEGGGGAVTNVNVFAPNDVAVWSIQPNTLIDAFIATNAGDATIDGLYTRQSATSFTNSVGSRLSQNPPEWWLSDAGSNTRYYVVSTSTTPWLVSGWLVVDTHAPVPTFISDNGQTNRIASLTNSLQWVSAPTGSVSTGTSGQYSISADTNQLFYWFSPSAISGSTTGVWLRVEGSVF